MAERQSEIESALPDLSEIGLLPLETVPPRLQQAIVRITSQARNGSNAVAGFQSSVAIESSESVDRTSG